MCKTTLDILNYVQNDISIKLFILRIIIAKINLFINLFYDLFGALFGDLLCIISSKRAETLFGLFTTLSPTPRLAHVVDTQ